MNDTGHYPLNIRSYSLYCILTLSAHFGVWAQGADESNDQSATTTTRSELIELLTNYDSFSAKFKTESRDDLNILLSEQSGIVRLTKPDRFLWRIDEPDEQIIAVQNEDVTVYDPLLEQVTYMKLQDLSGADVFQILMNPASLNESDLEISGRGDLYIIRSNSERAIFAEINISVEHDVLKEIVVHDVFDGFTRFVFSDTTINTEIEKEEFDIEIPDGTDVVGEQPPI